MKCVICKSPDIELKEVEEEIWINKDVFFIPIKVNVCLECGERYYDRKAMKYLEGLEKELAAKSTNFQAVGRVYKPDMKLINP